MTFWPALLAAGIYALDQASKFFVVQRITLEHSIPLLPIFSLTHVRNTGAAFGMFPGANAIFILVMLAVLAVLTYLQKKHLPNSGLTRAGLALLWGGALGNLTDRVRLGSVTDFLLFYWRQWHWPVFNVADSAITVGVCLLALASFTAPAEGSADGTANPAPPDGEEPAPPRPQP